MADRLESYSYPLGTQERCTVGTFLVDFTRSQAHWSDGMFAIHGYVRGEVVPTLDLILAHKHPEDRGPSSPSWTASARMAVMERCSIGFWTAPAANIAF